MFGPSLEGPTSVRVYAELARRAWQRQRAYGNANLAGLFTNSFFGYIRVVPLIAAFASRPEISGYDRDAAITWNWLVQSLITIVALWGWWEVALTIRSGGVAIDLARPIHYLGYWLARDVGRAAYSTVYRFMPILIVGQLVSGLRWPEAPWLTWPAFLCSLILALFTSFAWRFLLNLGAFWLTDYRAIASLGLVATTFLSGFLVPLAFFPPAIRSILEVLPFAAIIQTPATVFLERAEGLDLALLLAEQLGWAIVMLGVAHWGAQVAMRRVTVQGG